jgi:hypothetical protein
MDRKWIVRGAGTVAGLTLAIAALHLPAARPLLALVGQCPVGRESPTEIEEARRIALRSLRGSGTAPARPALGFALERTTEPEVRQWARTRGIACESSREATLLVCTTVPAGALGPSAPQAVDELAFGFRVRDHRLVNLTTLTTGVDATAAATAFATTAASLTSELGAAAAERLPSTGWDGRRPAFVRYRFADYVAAVSAMELPGRGIVMREQYLSAVDWRSTSVASAVPADRLRRSR